MAGLTFALAAAALAGCKREVHFESLSKEPKAALAERVRVLNGDVLVIDGVSVRLANAYAPQPVPYARCWAEALAAKEATREVRAIVSEAGQIDVRRTEGRDEFNRPLAFVALDRLDLGDTLYGLGLAARPLSEPFRWCSGVSEETRGAPPLRSMMDFSR